MCREAGVVLEFLPPYSPDFNPIKESFSALKAWIRRNRQLIDSFEDFSEFLALGVEEFMNRKDARGYFRSAGIGINNRDDESENEAVDDI
jgi:transposase